MDIETLEDCKKHSMTSILRLQATIDATNRIIKNNIPGAFVECGVYKGGQVMAMIKALQELNIKDREIYLYDTFEGMTKPDKIDINWLGLNALDLFKKHRTGNNSSDIACVPLKEVKKYIYSSEYPKKLIYFVKGDVLETLPKHVPNKIALLRLDTDWYKSTKHELINLYPLLSIGGALIIDDYGTWKGNKKAVDEYLGKRKKELIKIGRPSRILWK